MFIDGHQIKEKETKKREKYAGESTEHISLDRYCMFNDVNRLDSSRFA